MTLSVSVALYSPLSLVQEIQLTINSGVLPSLIFHPSFFSSHFCSLQCHSSQVQANFQNMISSFELPDFTNRNTVLLSLCYGITYLHPTILTWLLPGKREGVFWFYSEVISMPKQKICRKKF